jgi:IS30 family transposase
MQQYKQLTYEQRCQIEILKKRGLSQKAIAESIGVNQSTISRELRRNTGKRGYRCKQAQDHHESRRLWCRRQSRLTPKVEKLIGSMLDLQFSPEQISGTLALEHGISLSHERIYQYIWADKFNGGCLYLNLRRGHKKYQRRCNGKQTRGQIPNRVGIECRPPIVDQRGRIGDWEIDTVIGKGHSGALVTIVERALQFVLIARVDSKSAEDVTAATIELLRPYQDIVHSITADNGKEFAYHEKIAKELDTQFFFARPYHSWERGLNENTNGLIRQYFPKSTNFKSVTDYEVSQVAYLLNIRPRKTLGYCTPLALMESHLKSHGNLN